MKIIAKNQSSRARQHLKVKTLKTIKSIKKTIKSSRQWQSFSKLEWERHSKFKEWTRANAKSTKFKAFLIIGPKQFYECEFEPCLLQFRKSEITYLSASDSALKKEEKSLNSISQFLAIKATTIISYHRYLMWKIFLNLTREIFPEKSKLLECDHDFT